MHMVMDMDMDMDMDMHTHRCLYIPTVAPTKVAPSPRVAGYTPQPSVGMPCCWPRARSS